MRLSARNYWRIDEELFPQLQSAMNKLCDLRFELVEHSSYSPYSPNLAPSDYHIYLKQKKFERKEIFFQGKHASSKRNFF